MPTKPRNPYQCLVLFILLTFNAGCREEVAPPPPPKPMVSTPPPVDRLAPGEIAEGHLNAFGLKLPSVMRIRFRGPDRVEAQGHVAAEVVANYVRKRTQSASVELGAARTVFEQVRVVGDKLNRPLRIEVVALGGDTRLIVKDLSPPKIDPTLTPEERWKKHGFDKDGKLLDPLKSM